MQRAVVVVVVVLVVVVVVLVVVVVCVCVGVGGGREGVFVELAMLLVVLWGLLTFGCSSKVIGLS